MIQISPSREVPTWLKVTACTFAMLGVLPAAMGSVLVDFNTGPSYSTSFTQVGGGGTMGWNSTAGTGGSGAEYFPATGYTANTYSGVGNSFTLSAGESIQISSYVYVPGSFSRSNMSNFGLYLAATPSTNPIAAATTTGVLRSYFLNVDSSASHLTSFHYSTTGGFDRTVGSDFSGGGPGFWNTTLNTWYRLEVTYTKSATAGLWDIGVRLENWGSTGTSYNPANLVTLSQTGVSAPDLYNAATLSTGFEGYQNDRGIQKIDNFAAAFAIPEAPLSASFATGAGLLLLCRVRRLRRI